MYDIDLRSDEDKEIYKQIQNHVLISLDLSLYCINKEIVWFRDQGTL